MSRDDILSFLDEVLPLRNSEDPPSVHVTLTFAQSLDAKIAGRGGKQLTLSCNESMIMTHRLRSRHDAILVGIGTALNDNPQLNTRLLTPEDGGQNAPLPVILDGNLRFRLDSKLLSNYKAGKGRQPTIFTAADRSSSDTQFEGRRKRLEDEGVKIIPIASNDGRLDLASLLNELQKIGIRSLMVEGGASIISSFLQSGLVKSLVVTVCPTIVGKEGIAYDVKGEHIFIFSGHYPWGETQSWHGDCPRVRSRNNRDHLRSMGLMIVLLRPTARNVPVDINEAHTQALELCLLRAKPAERV